MNLTTIRFKQSLSTYQYLFGLSNINDFLLLDIIAIHKKNYEKNCVFSLFEGYWSRHISNNLSIKKTKPISYTFVRILQYHRHFMANKIILQKKI